MSNELAVPAKLASCPISFSPQCHAIVCRCRSGAVTVDGKLEMINLPTREERSQIATRLGMLANAIAQCKPKEIKDDIRSMLNCYPSHQKLSAEEANLIVAKYVSELQRFPAWAVARVCGQGGLIRCGQAGGVGVTFPASTIEIGILVERRIAGLQQEMAEISSVLAGSEARASISPEERLIVGAKLRRLADSLGAKIADDRDERRANAAAYREETDKRFRDREHARAGTDPDSLASPYLARLIKGARHGD